MKKLILIATSLLIAFAVKAQSNVTWYASSNWVAVPYAIYRTDTKEFGYGGAMLYKVTDYFYTGVRADNISGQSTTAGVQANLQASVAWAGFTVTPFIEASTGLGENSLYASAGTGLAINFYTWNFHLSGHPCTMKFGAVGDYEHVTQANGQNWQQVCGGPMLNLSF